MAKLQLAQRQTTYRAMDHYRVRRLGTQLLVFGLFAILTVIAIYPMIWIVTNSLKSDIDLFEQTWALPKEPAGKITNARGSSVSAGTLSTA